MTFARDIVQEFEEAARATALVTWARCADSFVSANPLQTFAKCGQSRFLPHVKGAVEAVSTEDTAVALQPLSTAFVGLVDRQSLLGALIQRGSLQFPMTGSGRLQIGSMIGAEVAEGAVKPVGRIDFEFAGPAFKIQSGLVVSAEALKALGLPTQNAIRDGLTAVTARATDVAIVSRLTSGSPSGSSAIGDLFANVSGGAPSRPAVIAGYDVLLGLAAGVVRDLEALGIAILPTPAAAGLIIAVDCAGLLIADDGVVIQTARDAQILMDDGTGSPTSTRVVSLFQQNLAAIRAERFLRLAFRSGAVAYSTIGSP